MKNILQGLIGVVLVAAIGWGVWMWGFCRFYVAPNEMAIVTRKTGESLERAQILAQPGQKGIQEETLGEGRHFRDPILHDVEIRKAIIVPAGKVAVVTSKVGGELPEGEFLANRGQKGIWRGVLGPGKYRLNPYGFQIELVDAISIPIGYAGVVTSLSGEQAAEGGFALPGQKGVREDVLQPGLYFVNPKEHKVDVVEIGVNQVSLLFKSGGEVITKGQLTSQNPAMQELQQNVLREQQRKRRDYMSQASSVFDTAQQRERAPQAAQGSLPRPVTGADASNVLSLNQLVEFPSRDGFEISVDMSVEFELLPGNMAWILRNYGDLPAVVDKIIMPQILSVSRLKGSSYRAKDFIVGEGREKFQAELTEALARALEDKRIVIHNALIRHVTVPMQILDPIQQASVAVEQDLTNKERQNTARKQAELNTETQLIEQRREQVAQETVKLRAEIKADEERQVATTRATTQKKVAEIAKQTADVMAERTRKLGAARAQVVEFVEGEKARGFDLKARAFGDSRAYVLWHFAQSLNEQVDVRILHAGEGTLWTDLDKASLGAAGAASLLQKSGNADAAP